MKVFNPINFGSAMAGIKDERSKKERDLDCARDQLSQNGSFILRTDGVLVTKSLALCSILSEDPALKGRLSYNNSDDTIKASSLPWNAVTHTWCEDDTIAFQIWCCEVWRIDFAFDEVERMAKYIVKAKWFSPCRLAKTS